MIVQHLALMLCQHLVDITGTGEAADRSAPALAPVERLEPAFERHARGTLQRRVQRRAHRQPAGVEHVLAEPRHDGTPHLLGEIGRVGAVESGLVGDRQRDIHRRRAFGIGDETVLRHFTKHPVAPSRRRPDAPHGMIVRRRLRQRCQIGHLLKRQLIE